MTFRNSDMRRQADRDAISGRLLEARNRLRDIKSALKGPAVWGFTSSIEKLIHSVFHPYPLLQIPNHSSNATPNTPNFNLSPTLTPAPFGAIGSASESEGGNNHSAANMLGHLPNMCFPPIVTLNMDQNSFKLVPDSASIFVKSFLKARKECRSKTTSSRGSSKGKTSNSSLLADSECDADAVSALISDVKEKILVDETAENTFSSTTKLLILRHLLPHQRKLVHAAARVFDLKSTSFDISMEQSDYLSTAATSDNTSGEFDATESNRVVHERVLVIQKRSGRPPSFPPISLCTVLLPAPGSDVTSQSTKLRGRSHVSDVVAQEKKDTAHLMPGARRSLSAAEHFERLCIRASSRERLGTNSLGVSESDKQSDFPLNKEKIILGTETNPIAMYDAEHCIKVVGAAVAHANALQRKELRAKKRVERMKSENKNCETDDQNIVNK